MSRKKYVLPNVPMSLLEMAIRALRVIWSDRFVVHHTTILNRSGPNWIVELLVQVHFKTSGMSGWTFVDVSIHVSESLRWATDEGLILVEVSESSEIITPPRPCAKVIVRKDSYDPNNPLDAWGRMYIRVGDQSDLMAIEKIISS